MIQSQPPITGTTHTLPFDKLSPRDFERLCLWLVEREGYERAEHPGAAGGEQGRDVVAWREGALWAFQCKRVRNFGPSDALVYELQLTEEENWVVTGQGLVWCPGWFQGWSLGSSTANPSAVAVSLRRSSAERKVRAG